MATPRRSGNDQTRTLLLIAAIVAVVAVIGVVVAVVVGGGDDEDAGGGSAPATVARTTGGLADCSASETDADAGSTPAPGSAELAEFPTDDIYKPVAVEGAALADFSEEMRTGAVPDASWCRQVPVVSGYDYDGNEVTIDPAADGPTMVVLLAHWCPHCNDEIPVLNEWRDAGDIPEGLDIVGVSTGVADNAPNYPPDEWLVEKDWQWPVLADDRQPDETSPPPAMGAFGGTSYPTLVLVDGDGLVRQRLSGEVPIDVLQPLVDDLVAESST